MNAMTNGGPAKRIDALSTAGGLIVAFVAAPDAYMRTGGWFFTRFNMAWGPTLAKWMMWGTGAAEAWLIYNVTALVLSFGMTSLVTWVAMKRFREM
jgi:hypothetical protein